jgi:AraC-like DNA-binding protein
VPWHSHRHAYAAVVLSGGYTEAGHGGRRRVEAGAVIVHGPFSAHTDSFDARGAEIVNVPLGPDLNIQGLSGEVRDPENLLRDLLENPEDAHCLLSARVERAPMEWELPDLLAAQLDEGLGCSLASWASEHGVAPRTLSRQFQSLYSTTAAAYRAQARARRAWSRIVGENTSLPELAYDLGFSDQAHMSRAVASLTGRTPRQWRSGMAV